MVSRLIDNLIQESKYNDLIDLMDAHIDRLAMISNRNTTYLKFRDRGKPKILSPFEIYQGAAEISVWDKITKVFQIPLRVLPTFQKYSDLASELIKKLLSNEGFVEHIVKSHSYIFIRFLDLGHRSAQIFLELLLRELLSDRRSILYTELENTQNVNHHCDYWIVKSNKFMHYLFFDPKTAKRLGIWKPVGEYMIEKLDNIKRQGGYDSFNTNIQNYFESSRWKSEMYIIIHFFNVMVSRSLYKNIKWHMWLYYYSYFVEGIVKNHRNDDPYYEEYAEWPTKYEYLLYEMFSNMSGWVRTLDTIPLDQSNVKIESTRLEHNNGNIPVSAIIVIGHCLKIIFESTTISMHFKTYILSKIFDLYFELRANKDLYQYSILLAKAILNKYEFVTGDLELYRSQVLEAFEERYDKVPIDSQQIVEFREILKSNAESL